MMLKYLYKERFVILMSLVMGFVLSVLFAVSTRVYAENIMDKLASEVFRFHVIANSDSAEDQSLKLNVRDRILEEYRDKLSFSASKEETIDFFSSRLSEIEELAGEVISSEGYDYGVKAEVCKGYFPVRKYADVTLPAGEYDCLRISIGEASGHNWWCVMFPPLCYVEGTYKEAEEHRYKENFDKDTYEVILGDSENASPDIRVKLKIVELWQKEQN